MVARGGALTLDSLVENCAQVLLRMVVVLNGTPYLKWGATYVRNSSKFTSQPKQAEPLLVSDPGDKT